jgi:hypothetical protein
MEALVNPKVKAYAPLLALIVAAVVAFAFVRGGDPDGDSEAKSSEITLPPIVTSTGESNTTTSAAPLTSGTGTAPIASSEPTASTSAPAPSTTEASPISQIVDAPDSVESTLRKKYAAVQDSQNLCEAVSLLLTIPDPALILSDEFGKTEVKEYVDLWEQLWADLKGSGQDELLVSLTPIAEAFQKLLNVIKQNDYTTSALATGFQDVASSTENISPYVDQFNAWRAGNCPSDVTVKITR